MIYLGLELQSLSMYALVALRRDDPRASAAAMKYFVLGSLASGFLLYGMSDEKIEMFLAEELTHAGATLDAGETLEIFTAPWQELLQWVRHGTVTDVKTMLGVMWLEKVLAGHWERQAAN